MGLIPRTPSLLLSLALAGCSARPLGKLPPVPLQGRWHTAREGETLQQLARHYRVPLIDIEEINGVDRRTELAQGQRLFIPRGTPATAKSTGRAPRRPSRKAAMRWPVRGGKISSAFGRRGGRPHEGIDIAAAEGTAVLAAADGTVIYAGDGIQGYGNLVILRHRQGLVTVYAHNRRNLVQRGTAVRAGEVIAEVGHTGRTSGSHLHFEVRIGEEPQDPLRYVRRPTDG